MAIPSLMIIMSTMIFLILERVFPGRLLPNKAGWYVRSIFINLIQLGITLLTGQLWISFFQKASLFDLWALNNPAIEGLIGWFIGTFFFYWWHRIRHLKGWWRIFHQIHHSPGRIEILTSFYKHPIEILSNSILSGLILYGLLGVSIEGAFWYNFFAATGEYFYHANLKSPKWLRYFIQTPELHSIHHQLDVHHYNFGDIPLWDRFFGTYKDTTEFVEKCGFPKDNERKLWKMLIFKDVYDE
ncbi:sterol desaturase family protein [Candidatus Amoebophilus asiaticus]|nr:sterol desaturase family protein [Candidatus Amoebophilus asiaticus]